MNTRYELNMDVPPREAIRLMYVSKSRFGGDWNSVPHTHSCTEVFYCVDGRGQFNVEGKMLDVAPDDMVIVNPEDLLVPMGKSSVERGYGYYKRNGGKVQGRERSPRPAAWRCVFRYVR